MTTNVPLRIEKIDNEERERRSNCLGKYRTLLHPLHDRLRLANWTQERNGKKNGREDDAATKGNRADKDGEASAEVLVCGLAFGFGQILLYDRHCSRL